jgi:hypothetical protein
MLALDLLKLLTVFVGYLLVFRGLDRLLRPRHPAPRMPLVEPHIEPDLALAPPAAAPLRATAS